MVKKAMLVLMLFSSFFFYSGVISGVNQTNSTIFNHGVGGY